MSDCQTQVFKLVAESKLPLSTNNIMQSLGYSEGAIRKSITNLRRKGMIESTGCRYFLTTSGKTYFQTDPTVINLEATIGSYVRPGAITTPKKSDLIKLLMEECKKTSFGQEAFRRVDEFKTWDSWGAILAPWVAIFAIQAGLITEPVILNGPTDDELDAVNRGIMNIIAEYLKPAEETYVEPDSVYK